MKAALIGLGMVSRTYGDAFRNSETVSLSTVFARSQESRTAFLDAWPELGARDAGSVEEIAADPQIDFVILTTPPNARADIVETLAASGKPILMEKPVERTLEAATALVETCEAHAVPLGIMLQHRARPAAADLRAVAGQLGELLAVEISVPWWRAQSYYDEPGRGSYARDGGGVLISQAIHTLDLAIAIAGPVSEVTAMAATTGFHRMEAEDFVSAGLSSTAGRSVRSSPAPQVSRAAGKALRSITATARRILKPGLSESTGRTAPAKQSAPPRHPAPAPIRWPSPPTGTGLSSRISPWRCGTVVRRLCRDAPRWTCTG